MIELPHETAPGATPELVARCRALGVGLLSCNPDGSEPRAVWLPSDPLVKSVAHSGLLADFIHRNAASWAACREPGLVEAWPGCLIAPMPQRRGRRVTAMRLALLVTSDMAATDQFHHLCRAAGLDDELTIRQLTRSAVYDPKYAEGVGRSLAWMARDLDGGSVSTGEVAKLSAQLGSAYEELSLTYRLSAQMALAHSPLDFLKEACEGLCEVLDLRWVAVRLTSTDARLGDLAGAAVHAAADNESLDDQALAALMALLAVRYESALPLVVDDASAAEPRAAGLAETFLVVPIGSSGRPAALLIGADKRAGGQLTTVDLKLATSTAQNMAIFLENHMLYEDLRNMFMGSLRSLIRSIDAKDAYTRGHSERVAFLSRDLAAAAGLDPHTVERVYLSGLLHDVGKIGIPESVLTKAGRLTDEEFQIIQTHPAIGARILRDIRQMADLIPGVLHHHERFDGRGYPHKLTGRDIPLFGRLICLADSFDAMSSDRTYRRALPLEKALAEIKRCAGTQFDPDLAAVFVTLDFAPYFELLAEHQNRRSPLDEVRSGLVADSEELALAADGSSAIVPASIARLR